ncbi:AgrD family cyclic lactone autoinducer peptide [Paenibacillus medicaginis]|uniref:AgrD family cyclic lactone autoinducer peptide n=1 Tax=Paenibacillus medicaginis TaxID=1470560 RepID=A0ABV5C0M3_9BACL
MNFMNPKKYTYYKFAGMVSFLALLTVGTASLSFIHNPKPPEELLK